MSGSVIEKIEELITTPELDGVITGRVVEIDAEGTVVVDFNGNPQGPIKARLTAAAAQHISRQAAVNELTVLLAFDENDIARPVIIDVIRDRIEPSPADETPLERNHLDDVRIDGETISFDAKKEIVLRCGKSSITLTRAGKVLIRGAYLSNRSSGVNRIKGGSVQIN